MVEPKAPVAQWIEQRFPKPRAHVRFMPGALRLLSPGVEMEVDVGNSSPRHPNNPRRQSRPDRARHRLHPVRPRPEPDGVVAAARRFHRGDHPAVTGKAKQDPARRFLAGIGPTDWLRSEHQPAKAGDPRCCARTAEREHRRRECYRTYDCQAHDPLLYPLGLDLRGPRRSLEIPCWRLQGRARRCTNLRPMRATG